VRFSAGSEAMLDKSGIGLRINVCGKAILDYPITLTDLHIFDEQSSFGWPILHSSNIDE
jgi:hypothetical protein